MRSPGYVQIISWLSQIMEKLSTNKDLIVNSFNITGITQSEPDRFHSALKHVLNTNETKITILDDLDGTEDLAETFIDDEEVEFVEDPVGDEETEEEELSNTSSNDSSDESDAVEFVPMNQFSAGESSNSTIEAPSQASTRVLTENVENISIVSEYRSQQKRKNRPNESDLTKKRKRGADEDETDETHGNQEPQRKKPLNDSTNTNVSSALSSTMQTRSQKKK